MSLIFVNNRILTSTKFENGLPILTDINNKISSVPKGMPEKSANADNNSLFEGARNQYVRSYTPSLASNYSANMAIPLFNRRIQHRQGNHIGSNTVPNQNLLIKKWTSNRDASQITRNRRVNTIGNGTLNASGKPMSFNTSAATDRNVINEAKIRVRSGGAAVPKKVTGQYLNPVRTIGQNILTNINIPR
jgi:hypothetical protein